MPQIVSVTNLVKRYKNSERNAVDGISFGVEAGGFFALLGPNGAGKTTTISTLTTTLQPTSGQVTVAGYDISKQAASVRQNIGIIFQKPSLDLNLTAEENVRFHAVLYGLYPFRPSYKLMPHAYQDAVMRLAEILGIAEEMFRPVKQFSGGMKRKLEIVRSLIHRPRVLFLDEPTTGLDPASRRSLWDYLDQVRRESGTTIFLTTHYLEEAEGASNVCIINHGHIVAHGAPAQIKAELAQEYLYLDGPDRARIRAGLDQLGLTYSEGEQFQVQVQGQDAYTVVTALGTPLTLLKTYAPTLEDAYLKIVETEEA